MKTHKSTSKSKSGGKVVTVPGLVERNLAATSPVKEQFEPTPASPIPQHKRMAGMP